MKTFYGIDNLHLEAPTVVTVGSFDGVHRGHRVLIDALTSKARELALKSVVVTFGNHPRGEGEGGVSILSTVEEKLRLLEDAGVDMVVVLPFNDELRNMSAEEFIESVLHRALCAKQIIVGYDHRFGKGQKGDRLMLENYGRRLGFDVTEIGVQTADGLSVSSTEVRKAISSGNMELVKTLLGHPYTLCGRYASGCVALDNPRKILPPTGRYTIKITIGDYTHSGMATIEDSTVCIASEVGIAEQTMVEVVFGC